MFIREVSTNNKKNGATYINHKLVEAYRTENNEVRQRIIMNLGTLTIPREDWKKLASALESLLSGQETLFNDGSEINEIAAKAIEYNKLLQKKTEIKTLREDAKQLVTADLNSFNTTEDRSLGPELVANNEWERLKFDDILRKCKFDSKEISLVKAVIIGKLIEPSSDLAVLDWLQKRSSINEMLPVDLSTIGKDLIYEISDKLILHKDLIEEELRKREETLFQITPKVFLYDLTNTYFEGVCLGNDLAEHGKCKSKRTDCPLVTLALVVDDYGFPVYSKIYAGNQSEPETLKDVLDKLLKDKPTLFQYGTPTFVMDRGIATKANITLMKEKKLDYIVIERAAVEKKYKKQFENAKIEFENINATIKSEYGDTNDVYIKKIDHSEETCRVLCLSEGRERKETAIDVKKEERFLTDVAKIKASIDKGSIKVAGVAFERVGRLKQRYASMAKYYDVMVIEDEITKKVIDLKWTKKAIRKERSVLTGCYVIETTHKEYEALEIWKLYMTLTNVEGAFKALKTDLGMRPVYHQNKVRTEGHLFISVLAYHLLINIERRLREKNDHRKWSTIKTELSTHRRNTIIFTDSNNEINHLRVSGIPESNHKEIYKLLDVKDPTLRIHKLAGIRL